MNEIVCCEKIFNGLLTQGFTPSQLVCALHNVLACGKGHKKAEVCINVDADSQDFTDLMENMSEAIVFARRIEGA